MACTAAWRLSTKKQLLHMLRMLKVACRSSLGTTQSTPTSATWEKTSSCSDVWTCTE